MQCVPFQIAKSRSTNEPCCSLTTSTEGMVMTQVSSTLIYFYICQLKDCWVLVKHINKRGKENTGLLFHKFTLLTSASSAN